MQHWLQKILDRVSLVVFLVFLAIVITSSSLRTDDQLGSTRVFTRAIEFDYIGWTVNAVWAKLEQNALGTPHYIDRTKRKEIVSEYIRLTDQILQAEYQLDRVYSDPEISDPLTATAQIRSQLQALTSRQSQLAPLAEAVLQEQVSQVLARQNLTTGGQPIPAVQYHVSKLPMSLITSPRTVIKQEANLSIIADLSLDETIALEDRIAHELDVSSLVVPVGGIGSYPTMVMRTSNLPWLANVIAHEWTHNYLTLRPLGINYYTSPELRTMNETTASIVGNEIQVLVIETYYPELAAWLQPKLQTVSAASSPVKPEDFPPPFDFRAEMHKTRVLVDILLEEGKVEEAEAYMEARRAVFWNHGYTIRKLNQAYFAFYGAYADQPGGAAGEDPVGPAVRTLRTQSDSLAEFVNRMAGMTSFEQLQQAIQDPQ